MMLQIIEVSDGVEGLISVECAPLGHGLDLGNDAEMQRCCFLETSENAGSRLSAVAF
ncbi:hypothetical protein Pan241w_04910 [Gimesia alba]|uniref:Uncharacterized protein n=1 Tax=Gimesia alba TaxID=2527973 RepID=A0A517R966_9PLAN|nr:hypothetical protein [Gimesia alba]QDT40434.1 hypothetical protein Pan241w_04910 [Gimesia alba]